MLTDTFLTFVLLAVLIVMGSAGMLLLIHGFLSLIRPAPKKEKRPKAKVFERAA
jgi:hypothetical protein